MTGVAQTQVGKILCHGGLFQYSISYWENMPAMYGFVEGCNHGYKFCLTFHSQVGLSLPGMVLPTQRISTLGYRKVHMW